jgi:hypothetical protein
MDFGAWMRFDPPKVTSELMGRGGEASIVSGSASNFVRQPAQQKKYWLLLCIVLKRAAAGLTVIPQTGSFCGPNFATSGNAAPGSSASALFE